MEQVQKDETIRQIREKYTGNLYEISPDVDPNTVVFYGPAGRIPYRQYLQDREGEQRYDAAFKLCYECVRWPDRAALDELFDRYPAFSNQLAGEILHKSGAGEVRSKKV